MQLCGVTSVDLRLTTGHHRTALAAHFNTAKGGLQLLSKPQCHFTRPCRLRTPNSWVRVIQHGMGQRGGRRKQEVRKHSDNEEPFHGQLPNIGLPEAMVVLPNSGRPMVEGKMSSR